jgi:hypothetical protein
MDRVLRTTTAIAAGILLALLGPATASAHKHIVAPGDPGSSQYQEDVPTAGGSQPIATVHPAASQTSTVVPQSTARKLGADGTTGHRTAAVATATAPPLPTGHQHGTHQGLQYRRTAAASALANAIAGTGGGMGALLPVLLGVSLLLAIAIALRRRGS